MKKRTIFLLIFFHLQLLSECLFAQKKDSLFQYPKESAMLLGAGTNLSSTVDAGMSPHLYKGWGATAVFGYVRRSDKHLHEVHGRFDYGKQNNTYEFSGNSLEGLLVEGNYFYGYKLSALSRKKTFFYVGPVWSNLWSLRTNNAYTNNSIHNDYYSSLSLGATIRTERAIWNRQFSFYWHAFIPTISYVIRPLYASSSLSGTLGVDEPGFFDYLRSGKISSEHRGFNNNFAIEFALRNNNKLRLNYQWNYRNNNGVNQVQLAHHTLSFSTMLNFRKP